MRSLTRPNVIRPVRRWRSIVIAARTCAAGAGLAAASMGCQPSPDRSASDRADLRESWRSGAPSPVAHPNSVVVAQGPAPLVYQAEQSGTAHVFDRTDGSEIASAEVASGIILRVSEDQGVFAGTQLLAAGPLPAQHQYAIALDVDRADRWRNGILIPRPPRPQTRPADTRPSLSCTSAPRPSLPTPGHRARFASPFEGKETSA